MQLLALDFETQDDKPKTTRVTEVGLAFTPDHSKMGNVVRLSQFCYEPEYPAQTKKIVEITGITDDMLKAEGRPRKFVFEEIIVPMIEEAEVVFAHKKAFDQVIFESTCKQLGITYPEREWICTLTEVQWPKHLTCHKLGHLAFELGMFDHPSQFDRTKLHRAGDDAEILLEMLLRKFQLDDVLAYAREPWAYFKADILGPWQGRGGDGGVQNAIAKGVGFTYERPRGTESPSWPKTWVMRVKKRNWGQVEEIRELVAASESPFRITEISGIE